MAVSREAIKKAVEDAVWTIERESGTHADTVKMISNITNNVMRVVNLDLVDGIRKDLQAAREAGYITKVDPPKD